MIKHKSPISSVAYSNNYIATAGYDNQVILWDCFTKTFINRGMHDHLANFVTFSNCGTYLLSSGSDYTARIWKIPEMALIAVLAGHTDDVESAAFSADGKFVCTASRDHTIKLFEITGKLIHTFIGHTADVLSVSWVNSDTNIVSSSDDGTLRIWDTATAATISTLDFDEVETDTCAVNGNWVYAGNDNGEIITIDFDKKKIVKTTPAHTVGIKSLRINAEYKLLVSCSYDCLIKIWRLNDEGLLTLLNSIESPVSGWLRAVCIIDERYLALGSFGSCYLLYDIANGKWNMSNVEETNGRNAALAIGKNIYSVGDAGIVYRNNEMVSKLNSLCNFFLDVGGVIVTGGQTGAIFNAITGETIYKNYSPVNCGATFVTNGKTHAIIGTYTGEGLIFILEEGKLTFKTSCKLHSNAIKGIASDSKTIFSVCANADTALHSIPDLGQVEFRKRSHDLIANGADLIRGLGYVSVSRDRKLRLWDSELNADIVVSPHTHSIKCVKVSTEGEHLVATGSYNGRVCIYSVDQKKWIYNKRITTSGISSLTYSEAHGLFFASSYDGCIYSILP